MNYQVHRITNFLYMVYNYKKATSKVALIYVECVHIRAHTPYIAQVSYILPNCF